VTPSPWRLAARDFGAIDKALSRIIRRRALRDPLSIREIARRTKLSRNTIGKYLRSGAVEPEFSVPERPSCQAG
jgi:AraC-like DNA-binding protein